LILPQTPVSTVVLGLYHAMKWSVGTRKEQSVRDFSFGCGGFDR